jgi:KUP system potassium uptake protein
VSARRAVVVGALGVVYGDIGTSPLYAMKECLGAGSPHAVLSTHANVLGVMSLVFWAMTLVVTVKYLGFVLRADNKGEGGILALAALLDRPRRAGTLGATILLALFGAGLLYGDGMITPAISVLSAMEGLEVATTSLKPLIVPLTVGILLVLFLVQRHGTHRIGKVFGWIMLAWFVTIGVAGLPQIAKHPEVFQAVSPTYAVQFFAANQVHGFLLLGSVVLVVTGGEALYADMGHFGRRPIRLAWLAIAMPGILLNYFGQAALMMSAPPGTIANPFYALVDGPLLYPMVVLATMAAIIASQALISGAFSLTHQAVQLGYLPRVTVIHTSEEAHGQIYIPEVNWLLMIGTLLIVVGFGSASALASAYGIAVTGTMAITSILFHEVTTRRWGWPRGRSILMLVAFLLIDLAFFGANVAKILHGGWVPLVIGVAVFAIMTTWWRGRFELARIMEGGSIPDDLFLPDLEHANLPRARGTAVFMTSAPTGIPNVLLHHVKHNQILHQQVVLLSIETARVPWVPDETGVRVEPLAHGFFRVVARHGFMQTVDVPRTLARCAEHGLAIEAPTTTYYLGRQTLRTTGKTPFARWRKVLFAFLGRNAKDPTAFFNLPPNRVVELGLQIQL